MSDSPSTADDLAIAIEDMQFAWPGRDGFTLGIEEFALRRGESAVLVGPSGGGKSTLLGLITGVLTPKSGAVRILQQDLSNLSGAKRDKFRADHMGIIFQQFNLLPYLSVMDNILLPLRFSQQRRETAGATDAERRETVHTLLSNLGIDPEDLAGRTAARLSVGQQQRIAAARAFLGEPQLIIADEPTSALDEGRQAEFLDQLFAQQKRTGAALLMVSHDSRVAERFDRVVRLEDLAAKAAKAGTATAKPVGPSAGKAA
ncbi:MAG: ABC transporter ATP-binding protein [Pseudomonadota bacterium]